MTRKTGRVVLFPKDTSPEMIDALTTLWDIKHEVKNGINKTKPKDKPTRKRHTIPQRQTSRRTTRTANIQRRKKNARR